MCEPGKQFIVYTKRKSAAGGSLWTRAGEARVESDRSVRMHLEFLPVDGTLHLREPSSARRRPARVIRRRNPR